MSQAELNAKHNKIDLLIRSIEVDLQNGHDFDLTSLMDAIEDFKDFSVKLSKTVQKEDIQQKIYDTLHRLNILTNSLAIALKQQRQTILKLKQQQKISDAYSKGLKK